MCGICGWLTTESRIVPDIIEMMCDTMSHRGPNDRGVFINGSMAIAMRRLSVIDVYSGHQPIHNEDESLWIVFNGEIYNYQELRTELEQKGHKFYTQSDTETILHLYEEFGDKTPEKLRGMFAFAIIDKTRNQLFIARDRFGIKPLYYFWDGTNFLFASEIKSILAFPGFHRELNLEGVNQFFTFGYVPYTTSMFKGIKKLLPGHSLICRNNEIQTSCYWNIQHDEYPVLKEEDYIEQFFEIFTNTVKSHLISDVPLGAFLSGGIDSSLVVGIMSKLCNQPVETFSIGYDKGGSTFDERIYSNKVANRFHTKHREFIIEPDIVSILPKIIEHFDEPVCDASAIPNYYLSQEVVKHVTVALSGLGGDELCAGYERYLGTMFGEYYRKIPHCIRDAVIPLADCLPDSRTGNHFSQRLKRFVRAASLPIKDRYYSIIAKFDDTEKDKLFTDEIKEQMPLDSGYTVYKQYWHSVNGNDNLSKLLNIDMQTYLVDDLLALTDRVSMAHSLEVRVPYLDHKLVEFFWSIPSSLKLKGFTKKYLLKKAAEKILPKEIIYRKKKGFSVPLTVWFRGSLKSYVKEILGDDNLQRSKLFNNTYIRQILDEHFTIHSNHDEKIFSLISFVIWHERYFNH
ncbi:MAG: asparagine synthase (glutamine-hydrolyzing) [Thermodesulfovibrionales bacterium]